MDKNEILIEILTDVKEILREHTHGVSHETMYEKERTMDLNQKIHQLKDKIEDIEKGK